MRRPAPTCVIVCLFLLFAGFAFAAETYLYAPVQDGFTTSGQTVPAFAPDRVLVQFTPEALANARFGEAGNKSAGWTGLASLDATLRGLDVANLAPLHGNLKNKAASKLVGADRWYRVDVAAGIDIEAAVAALSADPNLESVTPDMRVFPAATPNDPLFPANWGHNNTAQLPSGPSHNGSGIGTPGFDTNAKSAWNEATGYGNNGVVIAILDSGVDSTHPDLVQVTGYDFGDNDSNPNDDSSDPGHGTACAGVAAATANNGLGAVGIAGGCRIMPLKIANSAGALYLSSAASALYFAADNGADVASMSFGASLTSNAGMDAAIQYAFNAGVVMLAATGNENMGSISYPANNANVIAVGAASPCGDRKRSSSNPAQVNPGISTDPNGTTCDDEYWWGSNYGSSNATSRFAVTVLAPTILPTTDIQGSGGYAAGDYSNYFNGTSCATPYAAGVCALIKSANPAWGPGTVRAQLTSTAIDIVNVESGAGFDMYSGYGMVDAAAALGATVVLPPEANFAADQTDVCTQMAVNFTDLSLGDITTWSWVFGDGGTSSDQNPTHVYTVPGTYSVSLYLTGPEGTDSKTVSNYITVGIPAVANFASSSPTGTAPLMVNFIDLSTEATGRVWDFGDGGSDTAPYPAHTYTSPGVYTVTMIATGGCAPDTLIKVDYVTVTSSSPPTAAFSGDPVSGCGPLEVTFTDETTGDVSGWDWTFGDGGVSTDQNPVHPYTAPGEYDVRLIATGPGGADTLTSVAYVSVTEVVTAMFSAADTTGTAPLEVTFTDTSTGSPTSWSWDFGDAGSDTVRNPVHTYNSPGTYSVMLIATGECGPDTLVLNDLIVVDAPPVPVAAFTGDPVSGCAPLEVVFADASSGDINSWAWDFGDGGSSAEPSPAYTFVSPGTYTVSLTVTGPGGGDTSTMTDYVTVFEPVTAAFGQSETAGLAPLSVDFTDQSTGEATFWMWDFGDASTDTVQNPTHVFTSVDTFTVTLVVGNSCSQDTLVMTDAVRVVGVSAVEEVVPVRYRLSQNVPNPFNPMTTIRFELPEATSVRLEVYDISGRLVRSLIGGRAMSAGRQEVVWNGKDDSGLQVAAGVYFYHLGAGPFTETRRMTLVK